MEDVSGSRTPSPEDLDSQERQWSPSGRWGSSSQERWTDDVRYKVRASRTGSGPHWFLAAVAHGSQTPTEEGLGLTL